MSRRKTKHKNKHHIRPKTKGGSSMDYNIANLDIDKHNLLHRIFGNATLYEIICILIRFAKMKGYEKEEPKIRVFYGLK